MLRGIPDIIGSDLLKALADTGRLDYAGIERLLRWLAGTRRPLVIELGAGTAIPSVRRLGETVARDGVGLIRINPREPEVDHAADIGLATGALDALRRIEAALAASRH